MSVKTIYLVLQEGEGETAQAVYHFFHIAGTHRQPLAAFLAGDAASHAAEATQFAQAYVQEHGAPQQVSISSEMLARIAAPCTGGLLTSGVISIALP